MHFYAGAKITIRNKIGEQRSNKFVIVINNTNIYDHNRIRHQQA